MVEDGMKGGIGDGVADMDLFIVNEGDECPEECQFELDVHGIFLQKVAWSAFGGECGR